MVNFPNSLDDNKTLFVTVNNLRTQLTDNITNSDLVIPVTTTSGFPTSGFITILSDPTDVTQAEAIFYDGITATTFNAVQRGASNTPALLHGFGDNVDLTVVAEHHNELKNAILELEQFVGVSGSENFLPQDQQGNVNVSGFFVTNSGIFNQSLTISGIAVSTEPFNPSQDQQIQGDWNFSSSLTVSGIPVVTGTSISTEKEGFSFTSPSVLSQGGVSQISTTGFNNRSLSRRLVVTPTDPSVNAYQIDMYKDSSFTVGKLEYRATASGTFIDNDLWFHEDEENLSQLHLKIINNSLNSSTFQIDIISEVFF